VTEPPELPERVDLKIAGEYFGYWSDLEIVLSVSEFSTVSFSAPFEPDRAAFRATFRPFSYNEIELFHELAPLFTGALMDVVPSVNEDERRVQVSCVAKPAMLDCTPPVSAYPLEFNGLTLDAIASKLCSPFGVGVRFADDAEVGDAFKKKASVKSKRGTKFSKVALEIGDKIDGFLVGLAKQRGLVRTDDELGNLLFWESTQPGNPVAALVLGEVPVLSVDPEFKPQEYYSEITVFSKSARGRKGEKQTEYNKWLTDRNVVRPFAVKLDDTDPGDAPEAAKAKLGRMFGEMVSWTIELPTWRDPQGNRWEPNTTITLLAIDAMVYRTTEMLIRKVTLRQDEDGQTASLNVVLPGAFSGEIPTELPWD
jgi:prophage tail gpP-like protein